MRWFCLSLLLFAILVLAIFVPASWPTAAQNKRSSTQRRQDGKPPPVAVADSVVTPTPTPCTPPPAGMVSWWPGDGNANDIKGGNNGTLQGGATFASGEVGQAFSLNGTTADVFVPAAASLNVGTGNGMTIDLWINAADVSTAQPLVEWNRNLGFTPYGVHLWIGANGPGSVFANITDTSGGNHFFGTTTNVIAANTWQHVTLTWDRNSQNAIIYVNGSQMTSLNVGNITPQTSYDLYFGLRPSPTTNRYSGLEDEVELFNRALADSEIQAIFNAGTAGKCRVETISKAFGAASIPLNGTTTLSFTITNPNATSPQTGIGFADTLPAGLVISTPNGLTGSCGGGTITATQNTSNISLSGATLGGGASCTFSVNVTGTTAGVKNNTTGNVTSTEGGMGGTASASVTVCPPPIITCPGSITKFADSGQLGASINPGAPVISGGCSPVTVTGVRSDGKALNAQYPIGVTLITWTATDASSTTATCGQSIAVMVPSGGRRRP
jgi:hypothetical protein